jgi:hypothetical protein
MADDQAAPVETLDIVCNFIGDFEVADNMVRNGQALCALKAANEDGVFNKLMVIQAGSLVEVALAQIIYRAQNFNREGVPNITEEERLEIADKKVDKLNNIIQLMKKYKILDDLGADEIYGELHKLRKYRNKVHIQDDVDIDGVSRREDRAFSEETVTRSVELCARILQHLNEKHPRPEHVKPFARTVSLPSK